MPPHNKTRFQVFLSSTFWDLEDERQKILQAILELDALPSGMELFPSSNDEPFKYIERQIQDCDYYVVVVAGKYGSIADGLSFTEREYDYAKTLAKPVLAFLRKDISQLQANRIEDDPAKQHSLDLFRSKIESNSLVKFYSNSDELKSQVLASLTQSFQHNPQLGWIRADRHLILQGIAVEDFRMEGTPSSADATYRNKLRVLLRNDTGYHVSISEAKWKRGRNGAALQLPQPVQLKWQLAETTMSSLSADESETPEVENGKAFRTWIGLDEGVTCAELLRRLACKNVGTISFSASISGKQYPFSLVF